MSNGRSREDLLQFLDFLGDKGLMNPQTASARKASAGSLLSILSEDEARDVINLDLDAVTNRFLNLKGSTFKPESVRVYKSRTENAIRDFSAYKKDPLGFKPNIEQRTRKAAEEKVRLSNQSSRITPQANPASTIINQTEGLVFPIPIRADVIVKLAGIPPDLTLAEARKIANVILALATTEESF